VSVVPPTFRSFAVSALDPRLVGLTLTAAFACALVVSLVPALAARRADPAMALSHRERGRAGGRLRGGRTLLAIEAAFGILLVAGAGATGRSFYGLVFGDQGFVASDLYIVTFNGVPGRSDDAMTNRRLGFAMASNVIGTLPGMRSIGAVTQSPVGTGFAIQPFWRSQNLEGREYGVGPGAFEALGTPVLFGRGFTEADVAAAAPVAIVNERGARALWPEQPVASAVGRQLTTRGGVHTVVGVVRDIRPVPVEPAHASLFLPITDPDARMIATTAFQIVVRTTPGQAPDTLALERALTEVSPGTRVAVESVADDLAPWLDRPRFQAMLFAALAGLSLVLAAVGLFAVTAFEVTQRRYEMGVRLALGATGRDVGRLVLSTAVRPVLVGSAAGLVAAWWAGQFLQAFLVDVDARDPWTYALVALTLVATAVVAAWLPARRAARTDPAEVLRAG
jgi:predicted permease